MKKNVKFYLIKVICLIIVFGAFWKHSIAQDRHCDCEVKISDDSEKCALVEKGEENKYLTKDKLDLEFSVNITGECEISECKITIFEVVEEEADSDYKCNDLFGKTVGSRNLENCKKGVNSKKWDLEISNSVLNPGCYLVRLQIVLSDGTICEDCFKIIVVDCKSVYEDNINKGEAEHKKLRMEKDLKTINQRKLELDYLKMIINVQKCLCKEIEEQLVNGQKNFDNPCNILCVVANLNTLFEDGFKKGGEIEKASDKQSLAGGVFAHAFLDDILKIEDKFRAQAMYNCCGEKFKETDIKTIKSCIGNMINELFDMGAIGNIVKNLSKDGEIDEHLENTNKHLDDLKEQGDKKPVCPPGIKKW